MMRRTVGLALFAAVAVSLVAGQASAELKEIAVGKPSRILLAGPQGPQSFIRPDPIRAPFAGAANIRVTYNGFSPAAKSAFQRAVNVWAATLNSPIPITVDATYLTLDFGVLGAAGPGAAFTNGNFIYPAALANKLSGRRLSTKPDVIALFSSAYPNWHFGTGPAPVGTYDFTSVVMHELGHGLGFAGWGRMTDPLNGTVRLGGFLSPYDRFTENKDGNVLRRLPDNSVQLGNVLQSNAIFYDSRGVRRANKSQRAKLYAPRPFRPGSSYSHLDEATFGRGNPNSLMTPQLGMGETIRNPGPITRAIFRDIGW